MSPHDVYSVLALLLQGQDSGVQLLEFSIEDILNSDTDSPVAELEMLDLQIDLSRTPAESLSLPSVPATSTVIDPLPQSCPPLSESIIRIVIENVAEAGVLSIPDTTGQATSIKAANQQASQQSGTVDTSNTTKRRREEIEQGGQKKKHRSKLVGPTREQSSRYAFSAFFVLTSVIFSYSLKDANYRNKHVTVRPR